MASRAESFSYRGEGGPGSASCPGGRKLLFMEMLLGLMLTALAVLTSSTTLS
jgi:hypothetical protein